MAARAPSCRRRFLRGSLAASVVLAAAKPSVAAWFPPTPAQPAGPFYAPLRPLSIDNDLLYLPGSSIRADGDMLHIAGQVRDQAGKPIAGTRVEIWQANAYGRYNHPRHTNSNLKLDPNFQGFGHDETDAAGGYRFRTIKPAPYPDSPVWLRPPHIHFAVFPPGGPTWTTQLYFAGEPLNATDHLLQGLPTDADRARVTVTLTPPPPDLEPDSRVGTFDITLGIPGVKREKI